MAIKYQYAYDKNKDVTDITSASKESNYHCISCDDVMIAKQGAKNKWHFAHKHEQENCSAEGYLHKLAKQIFYDTYSECLVSNTPFYIELPTKTQYEPCITNSKINACSECNYAQTNVIKFDLTKQFKKIEIEKIVDSFKADLCLSTVDNAE
jgi:hypothetical protein